MVMVKELRVSFGHMDVEISSNDKSYLSVQKIYTEWLNYYDL